MIGPVTGIRAVITALALLLGLSACSGEDPEPKVAPPSPTAPSTTGTSAERPPEMPEAAKGTDAAAAEAFVRFYWEMVNEAQATGDVAALRSFAENCPTCDGGINSIESIYSDGGLVTGGAGRLSDLQTTFLDGDQIRAVVEFTLTNSRQIVDYPGATKDVTYPAGELAYQAILMHGPRGWRVVFLGER